MANLSMASAMYVVRLVADVVVHLLVSAVVSHLMCLRTHTHSDL